MREGRPTQKKGNKVHGSGKSSSSGHHIKSKKNTDSISKLEAHVVTGGGVDSTTVQDDFCHRDIIEMVKVPDSMQSRHCDTPALELKYTSQDLTDMDNLEPPYGCSKKEFGTTRQKSNCDEECLSSRTMTSDGSVSNGIDLNMAPGLLKDLEFRLWNAQIEIKELEEENRNLMRELNQYKENGRVMFHCSGHDHIEATSNVDNRKWSEKRLEGRGLKSSVTRLSEHEATGREEELWSSLPPPPLIHLNRQLPESVVKGDVIESQKVIRKVLLPKKESKWEEVKSDDHGNREWPMVAMKMQKGSMTITPKSSISNDKVVSRKMVVPMKNRMNESKLACHVTDDYIKSRPRAESCNELIYGLKVSHGAKQAMGPSSLKSLYEVIGEDGVLSNDEDGGKYLKYGGAVGKGSGLVKKRLEEKKIGESNDSVLIQVDCFESKRNHVSGDGDDDSLIGESRHEYSDLDSTMNDHKKVQAMREGYGLVVISGQGEGVNRTNSRAQDLTLTDSFDDDCVPPLRRSTVSGSTDSISATSDQYETVVSSNGSRNQPHLLRPTSFTTTCGGSVTNGCCETSSSTLTSLKAYTTCHYQNKNGSPSIPLDLTNDLTESYSELRMKLPMEWLSMNDTSISLEYDYSRQSNLRSKRNLSLVAHSLKPDLQRISSSPISLSKNDHPTPIITHTSSP